MKPFLTSKFLVSLSVCLLILSACSSQGQVSTVTSPALATAPAQAASPTDTLTATETSIPTEASTDTPAPTATLTFEQWVQNVQPDAALVRSVLNSYAQATGVPEGSIQLTTQVVDGLKGQFAVMLDQGTGIPLLITETNTQGAPSWVAATLGRLARNMHSPLDPQREFRVGVLIDPFYARLRGKWGDSYNFAIATFGKEHVPAASSIDFAWTSSQIREAQSNDLPVRVQHILFPAWAPDWTANGFTQDDLNTVVRNVMQAAVETTGVESIIVVNEADGTAFRNDPFWDAFQMEYIVQAFQTARSMNTGLQLGYNDSDNHWSGGMTTTITQNIVDALRQQGLIDFVGIQMHLRGEDYLDKADVIQTLQSYGVPVKITEFDIDMTNLPADQRETSRNQLTLTAFEACFESQVCDEISFWGADDSQSWLGAGAEATQYDIYGNPRESVFILEKAILGAIATQR